MAFQRVQKEISPICFNDGKRLSALQLHNIVYKNVSGSVNSQMTCSAIRLVVGTYASQESNYRRRLKLEKKRKERCERKGWNYKPKTFKEPGLCVFKNPAALFLIGKKGRDASFCKKDGKLSLWTVAGRKHISYHVPSSRQYLLDTAADIDSITVVLRNGELIGYVSVTLDVPEPSGVNPIGVDLNETNMFVASDIEENTLFVSGHNLKVQNKRTWQIRKRLQQKLSAIKAQNKDTRSLRRLLKRQGRKQSNRTRTFSQTAAKQLCQWAKPNSILVFEDLDFQQPMKGLVGCKNQEKAKSLRRRMSSWQRGVIRQCVENKAQEYGLSICEVNPAYTSQDCSRCGLRGKRKRHKFVCPHCEFECHADVNASRNIRNKFVVSRHNGLLSTSPEALVNS
jgi:putative transposase